MTEGKIGSMEEEAQKRKERLRALKRKTEDSEEDKNDAPTSLPRPKFRSYKPQDESLKSNVIEDAKPGDVETEVKEQLDAANSKVVIEELDISNLEPRKPDWDLKRDIEKKLDILKRRTQKAIAEEVRVRLKQGEQNLAVYVNENDKS